MALLSEPGLSNARMRAYVAWQNEPLDHAAIAADLYVESPLVGQLGARARIRAEAAALGLDPSRVIAVA